MTYSISTEFGRLAIDPNQLIDLTTSTEFGRLTIDPNQLIDLTTPQEIRKNSKSVDLSDSLYFINQMTIISSSDKIKKESTVKIQRTPSLQAAQVVFSNQNKSQTFAERSDEKLLEDAAKCSKLEKYPLDSLQTYLILKIFQKYQYELCCNTGIRYPARFKGQVITHDLNQEDSIPHTQPFKIEVWTTNKASLIFRNNQDTWIAQGSSKSLIRAFSLDEPKVTAYSISKSNKKNRQLSQKERKKDKDLQKQINQNEAHYLSRFNGSVHFPEIYSICYFDKESDVVGIESRQVIDMKFYSCDLFNFLSSPEFRASTDSEKVNYCIQLTQPFIELKKRKITHRDVKVENFLISKENKDSMLVLIDFGFAIDPTHSRLKDVSLGSISYASPQILTNIDTCNPARDVWALACVFWLLLFDQNLLYPWYKWTDQVQKNTLYPSSNFSKQMLNAIGMMTMFNNIEIDPNHKVIHLLSHMLRFKPQERPDPSQVLIHLQNILKDLEKNPNFNLKTEKQYLIEILKRHDLY